MRNPYPHADRPLTPREFAREVLRELEAHADPKRAAGVQAYFREKVHAYGLPAPDVRQIEKDLFARTGKTWTPEDALELCSRLLPRKHIEAKAIALLTLDRFSKRLGPEFLEVARGWLLKNDLDNWASVDTLGPHVVGTVIDRHPGTIPTVQAWSGSPNRWLRRASIVSFILTARRGRHLDAAYAVAEKHFPDEDDLIQKANGWMLREAGKTDMPRLERFLLRHGPTIPRTTLRYAIERFPVKRRRELLEKTRRP